MQTTEAMYKRGLHNSRSIQSQVFICTSIYAPPLLPQVQMQCWRSFLDTQVLLAPLPVWGFWIFVYTSNMAVVLTLLSLLSFPNCFHFRIAFIAVVSYTAYITYTFRIAYTACTALLLYYAVLGCTGLYWAILALTGLRWTVLGRTGLY